MVIFLTKCLLGFIIPSAENGEMKKIMKKWHLMGVVQEEIYYGKKESCRSCCC